jgi:hypothetical protein
MCQRSPEDWGAIFRWWNKLMMGLWKGMISTELF